MTLPYNWSGSAEAENRNIHIGLTALQIKYQAMSISLQKAALNYV